MDKSFIFMIVGMFFLFTSVHKERIIENFNIFDFELGQEDMQTIAVLDTKESLFLSHNDPEIVKGLSSYKFEH